MIKKSSTQARNAAAMKAGNRLSIISLLMQEPLTRAEIARRTGLTRAAVTIIVDCLINESVLSEKIVSGKKGATTRLLTVEEQRFLFVGIDITRTGYSVGLTDLRGQTLDNKEAAIPHDYQYLIQNIRNELRRITEYPEWNSRLQGVGLSVPGPVDHTTGLVINPPHFPLIQGRNILNALKDAVSVPIFIENNASARALYEKHAGLGKAYDHFMVMIIDTGIGSGLILNRELYRGSGYAGEIGHTSINPDGLPCSCGNRGCLERYAAMPMLLADYSTNDEGRPLISWKDMVDQAEAGDTACLSAIQSEADYLSKALINAANLLDLEAVILTGDIVYKPTILLKNMQENIQNARIARHAHDLCIQVSKPRENAGMASAAMIATDRFFAGQLDWQEGDQACKS